MSSSVKAKMGRQPRRGGRGSRSNTLISETGSTESGKTCWSKSQYHLENTYQLAPFHKVKVTETKSCMERVLSAEIDGRKRYEAAECGVLAQSLADSIKKAVKALGYPRYKLVASVFVGQDAGQDVCVTSRCTWNTDTDTSAVLHYKDGDLYVVATLFAVYFE